MGEREIVVALRGGYWTDQLDRLVRQLEPLRSITEPTQVTIDLSGLAFIGASPLAVLVAAVHDLKQRGLLLQGSAYVKPKSFLVARYLARMDFDRLLAHPIPEEDFARREERAFRPCQTFSAKEDLMWVADSLTGAASEACKAEPGAENAIWFALNELAQNVIQHAASIGGGIGVAQHLPKRKELEIAIADRGIGIRASLARNPDFEELPDDLSAIKTALEPGVSSTPEGEGAGIGLFLTRRLLANNGGTFIVRSGSGLLEASTEERGASDHPDLLGTLVVLRARIDRPLDLEPVLSALPSKDSEPAEPVAR